MNKQEKARKDAIEKQLIMCELRSKGTKAMLLRATLHGMKIKAEVEAAKA